MRHDIFLPDGRVMGILTGRFRSVPDNAPKSIPVLDTIPFPMRTKSSHPYNYDPIVIWQGGMRADATIYADRILMQDYKKHNQLTLKHFDNEGQLWNNRDPLKIEAFLADFCDEPKLRLVRITEYCNWATGFPTWRFDYYIAKRARRKKA